MCFSIDSDQCIYIQMDWNLFQASCGGKEISIYVAIIMKLVPIFRRPSPYQCQKYEIKTFSIQYVSFYNKQQEKNGVKQEDNFALAEY